MDDTTPDKSRTSALSPTESERPSVSKPSLVAGGVPAILSSLRHAFGEAGVARGTRQLLALNQKDGFDCPGCAWPDPDDRRELTEFCENGAKAVAEEATTQRASPEFFARHSVVELSNRSDYEIGKAGRVTHPMLLAEGATHYTPIDWDEALTIVATELNRLESPDQAVFYTSGRTSNEAAFVYQLFVRLYGTNNLPDCSNMCHESSGVAMQETLGVGKGTVKLDDFERADCIVVIGQNPGTNHPRMLTALERAARKGTTIISINPLFETGLKAFKHPQEFWRWFGRGTELASLHLPVRVNGDIAVLKGIMKDLLAREDATPGSTFAHAFIDSKTTGYEAFIAGLRSTSWEEIVQDSGVSRENIREAAALLARSSATICCWAMGITQQAQGVHAIREIINLLLLGGHFGRAGAGACPVRGHSNVQGDRTMGIYEKPAAAFLQALEREFGSPMPTQHGFDTVDAIHAMQDGRARVLFAMGGNFLSATPDTEYTAPALRQTRLTVHVSTKLNRSHLVHGQRALILPCLGRTEIDDQAGRKQFVSCENSMGVVQKSQGNLPPCSELLRSEVAIVCGLAAKTFANQPEKARIVDWSRLAGDYDHIRDHVSRVVPSFQDFNGRIRQSAGFYLDHAIRDELRFPTPSGKAQFTVNPLPKLTLRDGELVLMTVRSHDQFNTTIYGLNDRYRGISQGRRVVFLNREDIASRGMESGQWVDLTSHYEGQTRRADKFMIVPYEIPRGCAAAYFPEANVLVPVRSVVPGSNTPTYKSIVITLAPSASP
ncbi:MAG: FdhF/YdeP family oxidoreductase [Polyangiales bacterium]